MKNKKSIITVIVCILIAISVYAVDFTPQGDINLRSIYNIINAVDVNATRFYGDGSGLTGINGSGTVTSVATDDEYLTGGPITSSGTVTFNETRLNTTINNIAGTGVDTVWVIDDIYLNNITNTLTFNETLMNITIDARATGSADTLWVIDDVYLNNVSSTLTFNETLLNTTIDARAVASSNNYTESLAFTGTTTKTLTLTLVSGSVANTFTDIDTTYSAGNGMGLATTTFSVAGNTCLDQDADGLGVTSNCIGDTQLEYDTGQALTSASAPTFATINTGQGNNELYIMDQNVSTLDVPTFVNVNYTNPPARCSAGNAMVQFNGTTSECSAFLTTAVTSVASGSGMDFSTITTTGTVTMGTPSELSGATINEVTATSHTHAVLTDSLGPCTSGDICGGGHEHPASEVTAGQFGAGNYIFDSTVTVNQINMTTDSSKICLSTDCTAYINSTCRVYASGAKEGTGC